MRRTIETGGAALERCVCARDGFRRSASALRLSRTIHNYDFDAVGARFTLNKGLFRTRVIRPRPKSQRPTDAGGSTRTGSDQPPEVV